MIVHYLRYGHTACMKLGPPGQWEAGHRWSPIVDEINCPKCLAGIQALGVETFEISPDGKSITCKRCKRTSFQPKDVEQHYCGYCHVFHDDLWPPARNWFINATDAEFGIKKPC